MKEIKCEFIPQNPHLHKAIVTVPKEIVEHFFDIAAANLSKSKIAGFSSSTPISYIKQNFMSDIINHLKELLLKYFTLSHLYKEIRKNKISLIEDPRLKDVVIERNRNATFFFEFNTTYTPLSKEWKYVHFRGTKRKRYKDIDKQASEIIKEEKENEKNYQLKDTVQKGDWINFDLTILDENNKPSIKRYSESFWLKIGEDDTTLYIQEIFVGKKINDKFIVNHQFFQDIFNSNTQIKYNYSVKIKDIVPHAYICMENLKKHFKIKTGKKVHEKLVEVFSFNNDLSLRKILTREAFQTLLKLYPVETPNSCVLRRQEYILKHIQDNPDYVVYRVDPEFKKHLEELSQNQIKENAIAELLAHYDNLETSDEDVKNYLTLTQRARLSQFLHFLHPTIVNTPEECPIHNEELKQIALREKALNHMILHLTKE